MLEAVLVLLVDDEQHEFEGRGEDGAAGTDDTLDVPRRDATPYPPRSLREDDCLQKPRVSPRNEEPLDSFAG